MDGFLSCGAAGMVEDDDERASQWLCVNSCVSADGRLARAGSSGGGDELRANPSMPPPSIPTAHEYLENQTEVSRVQDEIIYELMQRLKEQDVALRDLRLKASAEATPPAAAPASRTRSGPRRTRARPVCWSRRRR